MKTFGCVLALLTISMVAPAPAKPTIVADYYANCAGLPNSVGHNLIVDPTSQRDGSYPTIAAALRLAKAGDTITLMTGDYGALNLAGINSDFISITAGDGQSPRFTDIYIGGYKPASHWRLTGVTVTGFVRAEDTKAQGSLILVANSDNIIVDGNNLYSQDGKINWQEQIPSRTPQEIVPNAISARQSNCISIVNNRLRNIFNGIDFGGDQIGNHGQYFLISGNSIDNFAGDGIDHYASHVRIEKNRITNGHDICNNTCVHNDGIQGWNYNHLPVSNSDILISGNVIIPQLEADLALPVDTLQGITIFDGKWDNVKIINNVVISNTWHGISVYGVHNAEIINNTLASINPARVSWIAVFQAKGDPPDAVYEAIIRNNVIPGTSKKLPRGPRIVADHNQGFLDASDYANSFVKFDPNHFAFDMRPSKGSPVIGEGSPESAPLVDIDGTPRQPSVDIGAFQYVK